MVLIPLLVISPAGLSKAEPVRLNVEEGEVVPLKDALIRGIEKNLQLQVEKLQIATQEDAVIINDAVFDISLNGVLSALDQETPSSTPFSSDEADVFEQKAAQVGLSKKLPFGLESTLAIETTRSKNNSAIDALNPQYKDYLLLDLTQPLLRDFGQANTANLRVSKNQVRQASYGYLMQAQLIANQIETAYYDLDNAGAILNFREESRELAMELLEGNQKRFEAGLAPITEVQEAETSLASRDELVVVAAQQVEILSNRLKDLLEIRSGDLLYEPLFRPEPVGMIDRHFPEKENAIITAFEKRPDLQMQKIEIENLGIRVAYFSNQTLPKIDLISTLGVNGLSGGNRPVNFGGTTTTSSYVGNYSDAFSSMADGDGYEWFVGLRFSYPLGNRAAEARLRQVETVKKQAVINLKSFEGRAETEVMNALIVVNRSLERVEVTERFEKLAEISLEQETKRLKEGLSNTFRVLIFQTNLINARIRKATALADFNKGLAGLYYAMGTNLARFDILAKIDIKGELYE